MVIFTYLQARGGGEGLVSKELSQLIASLDLITLVFLRPERSGDILELPRLNVVVFVLPAMNVPLNSISVVAYHESEVVCQQLYHGLLLRTFFLLSKHVQNSHYWFQSVPQHCAHFLDSKLEATIADKKDGSTVRTVILSSQCGTLASSNRVPDTAPKHLTHSSNSFGKPCFPYSEV